MKTAVLIWGEFREFENAHKSWNFLNKIDYDIYFSTWETTRETNDLLNIDLCENVTSDRILKYFPNATINIETPFWSSPPSKVVHHWRKLFNMAYISGINYDNIILIRPDIVLDELHESFELIFNNLSDERIVYALSNIQSKAPPVYLFVADCMFFGKTEIMREAFLSFPPPDITRRDIHYHLSKHFIENDIFVENVHGNVFQYFIMRSINRNFLHLTYNEQRKIAEEWYYAKYHNQTPTTILNLINQNTN
jgi:hypothetical protein